MAFRKESVRTPVSVGEIRIPMIDPAPGSGQLASIRYQIEILYSDGSAEMRAGNLVPELTGTQINSLQTFLAAIRTKAVAEFIG